MLSSSVYARCCVVEIVDHVIVLGGAGGDVDGCVRVYWHPGLKHIHTYTLRLE